MGYRQAMNMLMPGPEKAGAGLFRPDTPLPQIVVISSARGWRTRLAAAAQDFHETLRLWPLIWALSLFDIRLRYRGSLLGPFWLTLSTGVMIGAIGFVYARLFHQDVGAYLPFLAVSLVLWNFLNTVTGEGATCFTQSEGMVRAMRMPHALHAARVVVRNFLVLAHNILPILIVFAVFPPHWSWPVLSLPAALLLWMADCFAVALLLGVIGARFRDVPPIVGSIMQIAFYLTPIMWSPEMLTHRGLGLSLILIEMNPFYGMLEILRAPLLGQALNSLAWINALAYSALLMGLAFLAFARTRQRIPYWI
jgi:lipopolysaccharide transport system permease protein